MVRVEEAHRFAVPVERGFAFITDTANWPRFWPGYVRLEDDSPGVDLGLDVAVREQHAGNLAQLIPVPSDRSGGWSIGSIVLARPAAGRALAGVVQWQNISFPS